MPENEDVWDLWTVCGSQWRVGVSGIIGLDYPAVYQTASGMEIDIDPILIRKIGILERDMVINQAATAGSQRIKNEYCKNCADLKQNFDCATCNLDEITGDKATL